MKTFISQQKGFTLVELLTVLVLTSVLLMVAVPSFITYRRNSELNSATNTLFSAINAARGEAIKRGTNALITPVDGADWNSGWLVYVYKYDNSRTGTTRYDYDAKFDTLIFKQTKLPSYITVSGNGNAAETKPYIMYDASGYTRTQGSGVKNVTFTLARNDVSGAASAEETRRIKIAITGRARTCKPSADTSCTSSN